MPRPAPDVTAKTPAASDRPSRQAPTDPVPPSAQDLPAVAAAARTCRACPLWLPATQTVFGAGPANARLFLVGEQPGDEEDKQGAPFVGPAGKVLAAALEQIGVARDGVYVTNAVKHFKFVMQGARRLHQKPKALEIRACQPWLEAEIDRVQPAVLVALGATAAAALFGSKVSIERDRGRALDSRYGRPGFVTYHPSAALRAPDADARQRIRASIAEDLARAAAQAGTRAKRARSKARAS